MSSRAGKMEKQIVAQNLPSMDTKEVTYEIDVEVEGFGSKAALVVVTGIPADLPAEYEPTIERTAEAQFTQALNSKTFLEFYNPGKSAKDEQPTFINLTTCKWIKVHSITKIDEKTVKASK